MYTHNPDPTDQYLCFSRLHGLIIGINEYKAEHRQDLQGCVGDARVMCKYFTDHGVLSSNLLCLFDNEATREGILAAFQSHLIDNPDIQPYDPIVIYFAGHGDRMPAPESWHTPDGMVEMILPHDASFASSGTDNPSDQDVDARSTRRTNTKVADEEYIHGISDLTLAFLLYQLSQKKGNNITVILDSCHSGSGTRGEVRSRNSHDPNAPPIPDELDGRLRKSMSVEYPSELNQGINSKKTSGKLMVPSLETHILLAACQDNEQAQETPNNKVESGCSGVFTTALLNELRKCDLGNTASTSYATLIRKLLSAHHHHRLNTYERAGSQTFQCEGRNQDRLLFSTKYSTSKGKIALIPTTDKSGYCVRVGSAQGIVPGTEFRVFSDRMDRTAPPIILVSQEVGTIESHLRSPNHATLQEVPEDAYASIIKYNDHSNGVRIWVDGAIKQNEFWREVLDNMSSLPVSWATSPHAHDIALLSTDKGVELKTSHLTPGQFQISRILKPSLGDKQLEEILAAVVYFHFHLKHHNQEPPVQTQLRMTLRELGEKPNSWGSIIYEPKGDDLFGKSVSDGTVATLRPDPNIAFGLELINNSGENLYPYVLYYDFEDYSVGRLYEPPSRSGRPPLQTGQSLAIGYGSGGSQPFQVDFTSPGSKKEYGAFLLMVFSEWVDIAYLQQESPFGHIPFGGRGERHGPKKPGIWDTLVVRVELIKGE
ncbi:caspase domain-containing protein [Rhizoctonia solani]|nr:caspase domain-containing protein [Rhizoctonia solani]